MNHLDVMVGLLRTGSELVEFHNEVVDLRGKVLPMSEEVGFYLIVRGMIPARRNAVVKAGDFVTVTLEPDTENREIEIPMPLERALGAKLTQKLDCLSFTHKKEFIVWYSEAKKEDTRARRVGKMRQMLSSEKVIS